MQHKRLPNLYIHPSLIFDSKGPRKSKPIQSDESGQNGLKWLYGPTKHHQPPKQFQDRLQTIFASDRPFGLESQPQTQSPLTPSPSVRLTTELERRDNRKEDKRFTTQVNGNSNSIDISQPKGVNGRFTTQINQPNLQPRPSITNSSPRSVFSASAFGQVRGGIFDRVFLSAKQTSTSQTGLPTISTSADGSKVANSNLVSNSVSIQFPEPYLPRRFSSPLSEEDISFLKNYEPKSALKLDGMTAKIKVYKNGVFFGQLNAEGRKNGLGIIFYYNGRIYEGDFQADVKDGQGWQRYPDGSLYVGSFQEGLKNGEGKFEWANGQFYQGQWISGKRHGRGGWTHTDGAAYVGEWDKGFAQGFGVYSDEHGNRFQGQFKQSHKNGRGTERYSNGDTYVGEFSMGRRTGKGQLYSQNGSHFTGYFSNGVKHGEGTLYEAESRSKYYGDFVNDKKCGKGRLLEGDGSEYVGQFHNDLKHGYGEVIIDGKVTYSGYWLNGEQITTSIHSADQFGPNSNFKNKPISSRYSMRRNSRTLSEHQSQLLAPRASTQGSLIDMNPVVNGRFEINKIQINKYDDALITSQVQRNRLFSLPNQPESLNSRPTLSHTKTQQVKRQRNNTELQSSRRPRQLVQPYSEANLSPQKPFLFQRPPYRSEDQRIVSKLKSKATPNQALNSSYLRQGWKSRYMKRY